MNEVLRVKVINISNVRVKYLQKYIEKVNSIQNLLPNNILPYYVKCIDYPNITLEENELQYNLMVRMNLKHINEEDLLKSLCEMIFAFDLLSLYHGNIKPSNILFDNDDNIMINDYFLNDIRLDIPFSKYKSPEVIKSNVTNTSSDIWSTGVILYEIIENKTLFNSNNDILLLSEQIDLCNKHISMENKNYENLIQNILIIDKNKRLTVHEMKLRLINIKSDLQYHYSQVAFIKSFDINYYYNIIHSIKPYTSKIIVIIF